MFRWLAHKQACKLRSYASSKLSSVECDWATSIAKNSEQYLYVVRRALTRALWRSINGAQFCQMRSRRFSWATERGWGDVSCFMVGPWWHFCRSMKAEWCCFDGAPRSQGFTFFWPTPFTSFQLHASGENQPLQEISNALLRTRDTFFCGTK